MARPGFPPSAARIAERLRALAKSDRVFAMADQALLGAANLIAMACFARMLPKADFGALGAALGVHFVLFGFHRANLVLPFILAAKSETEREQRPWAWFAIWISVAVAVLLLAASWIAGRLPIPPLAAQVLLYAAILSPAMLLQEFGRRWLYQARQNPWVVASSGVAAAIVGLGLVLEWTSGRPSLGAPLALAAGSLGGALVAFARRSPWPSSPLGEIWERWRRKRRFSLWQSLTHVPYVIYNNGYVLLLTAISGPLAAAGFMSLRTLLSPAVSLISAVDSTDKLRAVSAFGRDGVRGAKASVDNTRRFLLALNTPFLLVVCVLAGPLQTLVFGAGYVHVHEAWVMAAYFLLLSVNQPYETFLIVQESGRPLFLSRLLSAGTAIGALCLLGPRYGLLGAAWALVIAQGLNCLALYLLSARELVQARVAAEPAALAAE